MPKNNNQEFYYRMTKILNHEIENLIGKYKEQVKNLDLSIIDANMQIAILSSKIMSDTLLLLDKDTREGLINQIFSQIKEMFKELELHNKELEAYRNHQNSQVNGVIIDE